MRIVRAIRALRQWRQAPSVSVQRIGYVPTMGALHAGHRALLQRARSMSDVVVVSIFVNPLQFGPSEDFAQYPRTRAADLALCRDVGVDLVFLPSTEALYPADFQTSVTVSRLAQRWEGACRPTHFQGVTTVMTKLLHLIQPQWTVLGQKDYQQYVVIRQLVKDLNFATALVMCPTVREPDGLALSSRNRYLTPIQRRHAPALYRALRLGQGMIRNGQRSPQRIQRAMTELLQDTPELTIEYIAVADAGTLEPATTIRGARLVLLGAVRLGSVRLIDNILVRAPR
ncbi:MAG: pantoate--beta-alanine ligase [Nitrospirae bacterium]|nr:MAG: pantoate--beta-alanine ligase [Nitrospirota bacterium]